VKQIENASFSNRHCTITEDELTPSFSSFQLAEVTNVLNSTLRKHEKRSPIEHLLSELEGGFRVLEFARNVAARKIQKFFKAYLLYKKLMARNEWSVERKRQEKLEKILACKKIIRHVKGWMATKEARRSLLKHRGAAMVIQRAWRKVL